MGLGEPGRHRGLPTRPQLLGCARRGPRHAFWSPLPVQVMLASSLASLGSCGVEEPWGTAGRGAAVGVAWRWRGRGG